MRCRPFRPPGAPAPESPPAIPLPPRANHPPGGPGRKPKPPAIIPSSYPVPPCYGASDSV